MMTAYAKVDDAVVVMREGAVDYLCKPFSVNELTQLVQRHAPIRPAAGHGAVAKDSASLALLELAKKVARTEATVLITGPSGTGKKYWRVISTNNPSEISNPSLRLIVQRSLK